MSFEALKKNRTAAINNLLDRAQKANGNQSSYKDERYWKPTPDKSGSGQALIRFMPPPDGEEVEWVQYYDHGFKGPNGRWYIEKSLTSIGQKDPVSEMNSQLWQLAEQTGDESKKEIARSRKRRRHFVSNIYVISDPSAPENEGKVFLFRYGKRIFDKISQAIQPEFEDETPINPFDLWEGANFKLRFRIVDGQRSYDLSTFATPSPLLDGNDEKLKQVYESLHSLQEILDPSSFKSYDELRERLMGVLGDSDLTTKQQVELSETAPPPVEKAPTRPAPDVAETVTASSGNDNSEEDEDDDDDEIDLKFYQDLAKEE